MRKRIAFLAVAVGLCVIALGVASPAKATITCGVSRGIWPNFPTSVTGTSTTTCQSDFGLVYIRSTTCLQRQTFSGWASINCASTSGFDQVYQHITHFCDYTTYGEVWRASVAVTVSDPLGESGTRAYTTGLVEGRCH